MEAHVPYQSAGKSHHGWGNVLIHDPRDDEAEASLLAKPGAEAKENIRKNKGNT
jgi:hypothetical protein